MEWLSQNWIFVVLAVGLLFMMRRGGMGCGGHRHGARGHHHDTGGQVDDRRGSSTQSSEASNEGGARASTGNPKDERPHRHGGCC